MSNLPSGLKAGLTDRGLVNQGKSDRPAGHGVPEPRRLVRAPGEEGFSVGTEDRESHPVVVFASGCDEGLAGDRVPEPHRPFDVPVSKVLAVRAERECPGALPES